MTYDDKDLAYWITRLVSEDREERNAAAKAFEVLSNPSWESTNPDDADRWIEEENVCSERFWTELRRILHDNALEPYGMTAAEFVHRLLATHIMIIEDWHNDMEAEKQREDDEFEALKEKYGGDLPPEALARWLRRRCIQIRRDCRDAELNGPEMCNLSGVTILFTIQHLSDEFLPAADTLRWMIQQEQYRYIAMDIMQRLGEKGDGLLDDIFQQLLTSPRYFGVNNAWNLGPTLRRSPDATRRLLALLDHENTELVESALSLLIQCGPIALRYAPESEDRLISMVETTFDRLYGSNPIPIEDRILRNEGYARFCCSVLALGAVGQSERTKDVLLGLTNVDVPCEPLKISGEIDYKMANWELKVAPRQLVLADVITAFEYFARFPDEVVPKLTGFWDEFKEFDCDMGVRQRIVDALTAYGEFDSNLEPYWLRCREQALDEAPLKTFRNLHESYFEGVAEKLSGFIRQETQNETGMEFKTDDDPCYDDDVVALLGRLGNRASCALPVLCEVKSAYEKHYGRDCFEDDDVLLQAIMNIEHSV